MNLAEALLKKDKNRLINLIHTLLKFIPIVMPFTNLLIFCFSSFVSGGCFASAGLVQVPPVPLSAWFSAGLFYSYCCCCCFFLCQLPNILCIFDHLPVDNYIASQVFHNKYLQKNTCVSFHGYTWEVQTICNPSVLE